MHFDPWNPGNWRDLHQRDYFVAYQYLNVVYKLLVYRWEGVKMSDVDKSIDQLCYDLTSKQWHGEG